MEKQIDQYFSDMFGKARLALVGDNTEETAVELEKLALNFGVYEEKYNQMVNLMNNLRHECRDKASEIREEIELHEKYENKDEDKFSFVFQGKYKNMSWGDISDIEERRDRVVEESKSVEKKLLQVPESIPWKTISEIDGVKLPREVRMRIVPRLDNLPPAFGWYQGDKKTREGVYIRLPENMFVRIPLPDVIDGTQNYTRNKTIKCKHETQDQCLENRKYLADRYNTEVRACLFAHKGDAYSKVGTNFRCPANPRFGSHMHLSSDVSSLKADEVKPVLMYSLSDLLVCYLWNDFHHKEDRIVFDKVEICQ